MSFALNSSYLPDIAHTEQQDRASAFGFSLGYIGSVLLLLINLWMLLSPETFSISDMPGVPDSAAEKAMRLSFVLVGIWWIAFSAITFVRLPKGAAKAKGEKNAVMNGIESLRKVLGQIKKITRLHRYLIAFFVYSMAVQTIMLIAAFFGEQEVQWGSPDEKRMGLIICILLIQLVAIAGAFLMSYFANKIGNVRTLIVVNAIWVVLCVVAFFVVTPTQFYIAAAFIGLVMGGIQSLSRSTYTKFLPETGDTASFFSFYDLTEKIGIILGMIFYAVMTQLKGMRAATLGLALMFCRWYGFIDKGKRKVKTKKRALIQCTNAPYFFFRYSTKLDFSYTSRS